MIDFKARDFLRLAQYLKWLGTLLQESKRTAATDEDPAIDDDVKQIITSKFDEMIDVCRGIGLELSIMLLEEMKVALQTHNNYHRLVEELRELERRVDHEMSILLFMVIPRRKAGFYEQPELLGAEVANNFPSATFDSEEAGNCFATGRHTACVFHLLRVVEVGVKSFSAGLGILPKIKTAQPSWGEVLREAWSEIQAKNKSGDPTWTTDKRKFFENVQSDLQIVKTAWRNPTMHVENTYDEERAEDIFNAVKTWMRHLAKHLDESGRFTP